ncbi:MAG: D-tyrosyl-tRNA(Tyr) deacylase [bacterium]|nr:D-tyrosyl-tRNA(Tyr) deacylase [bacterium]
MRIVLQKVSRAEVRVERMQVATIGPGLVALIAVERGDNESTVASAVDKLSNVRCFPDENGRMNLDPARAGAEFLLVSQFTLAARLDRGRRPSFERAAQPARAEKLLELLADGLRRQDHAVAVGRFGAHMEVELVNDGPVTLILELGA